MSRSDPQVNFRIPAELKARLEAAAAINKRSITAELVDRLEETFEIERELESIAPGSSLSGVGAWLGELVEEVEDLRAEVRGTYHTEGLAVHLEQLERVQGELGAKMDGAVKVITEMLARVGK